MLSLLLTSTILLAQRAVAQSCVSGPKPWGFFTNNTIYQTTGPESITYPRFVELTDGTIIATASLSGHTPGYFPVLESTDGGATWEYISDLRDQIAGVTMEPGSTCMLVETERDHGSLSATLHKVEDLTLPTVLLQSGNLTSCKLHTAFQA
jgi:hypothetical protein